MHSSSVIQLYIAKYNPMVICTDFSVQTTQDNIDMAIIDGTHTYTDLSSNIESALGKLNRNGVIFIRGCKSFYTTAHENLVKTLRRIDITYDNIIIQNIRTDVDSLYAIRAKNTENTIDKNDDSCPDNISNTDYGLTDPVEIKWIMENVCTMPKTELVDIVYTLADVPGDYDYENLKISLRSIAENAINVGNVWICSDNIPKWCRGVQHIKCKDTYKNCKDANIINKLLTASTSHDVSDRFIFMSDDQVVYKPTYMNMVSPVYNCRGVSMFKPGKNKWSNRMINTLNMVSARGGSSDVNWDSHVPQPIDKRLFTKIMLSIPYTEQPGVCVNTAYFGVKCEPAIIRQQDVKDTYESADTRIFKPSKNYIGYNDAGYNAGLRSVLLDKFNDKCKYEEQ